jgi:hypothetical protein
VQGWAITVNLFFAPSLFVQAHHRLIATGPYRFIRHPGYLAMLVTMPTTAVTLGSLAALLPALGYDLLILNRTVREDGFLRNTLGLRGIRLDGSLSDRPRLMVRSSCDAPSVIRTSAPSSLIYLNRISDIKTRSRGRGFDFGEAAGAFSFRSRGRGTLQTRLSKLAGPPMRLPYRHVILWWALGLAIIYWLFEELVWIRQLSAVRSVTTSSGTSHVGNAKKRQTPPSTANFRS